MKIVITGSRGFVGSALMKLLPQHEIIEWDTKIGKDIGYFQLERGTDFVVHLAGLIDIRDSINHPESYWTTNVEYSKKIFELCNYENVGLVYASSAAAKVWHLSPYGVTKKICEVSADAAPHIRQQAEAFQNYIYTIVLYGIKNAITSDRTTMVNLLNNQGHNDMAKIIKEL